MCWCNLLDKAGLIQFCWTEINLFGSGSNFSGNLGSGSGSDSESYLISFVRRLKQIFKNKTAAQNLILKRFLKSTCESFCPCSKIDGNKWVLSRFHGSLSDPNPKWIIPNRDLANNLGSHRIRLRILNTNFIWPKWTQATMALLHRIRRLCRTRHTILSW